MASANTLTLDEIRLIKGMLALDPVPTDQAIIAHFSRPGRDLNHRIVAEIRQGRWPGVVAAPVLQTRRFMLASSHRRPLSASAYLAPVSSGSAPLRRWLGDLHLDWWPVGQGLFSSGVIKRGVRVPLAWVYDCGSSTREPAMQRALDRFEARSRARGVRSLRLAVLSHFDKDHISGFVRLLKLFPVRTLLLPYIPASRRLAIALAEGLAPGDELWAFFEDPAAWLLDTPGIQVEEILYVQAAGPDDLPEDSGLTHFDPTGPRDVELPPDFEGDFLKTEYGDPPEEAADDAGAISRPSAVRFLKAGGRLLAPLLWEFVPYNDAVPAAKITPAFVLRAQNLRRALLDRSRTDHDRVLKLLKKHYENRFSKKERNVISLYLYSGPLSPQIRLIGVRDSRRIRAERHQKFSQMHTGDAYLDTDDRWNAFSRFYFRGRRLARSAFLQVMHHGSKRNWQPDLASRMAPTVSIFSSSTLTHEHHPDADVLRDFWLYNPVQVDGHGYHVSGVLGA